MTTKPTEDCSEESTILNERFSRLAQEKSFLQLTLNLINKIITVSGLDNIADNILQGLLNVIGGTNLILYYNFDNNLHYADLAGEKKRLDQIDDELVRGVFTTGTPLEQEFDFTETQMTTTEFCKAYTWVYALKIGSEIIGVLKIENLHISMKVIAPHLLTLFSYLAMTLNNEILEQSQLKKAYDKIAEEVAERRKTEIELLHSQEMLEMRVEERTAELQASEEKHRTILQTAMDGIWLADTQGHLIEVNETYCRMSGYSVQELLSMSIPDLEAIETDNDTTARIQEIMEQGEGRFDSRHRRKDGTVFDVEASVKYRPVAGGQFVVFLHDITERKQAEAYREMVHEVLQILNEPGDLQDSISQVIATLKTRTGFDAVGIRLQDGDDFPYFCQKGFPKDFLLKENSLIERIEDGGVCRDKEGNVCLECTCGLVISGKSDPAGPLFTPGGSFWTNDSFPILEIPPDEDPRLHPRNECIHQGYASVAMVPIRNKERIVGLIQFNDRHKGRFTLSSVALLEGIAAHIGEAMMRNRAEEEKLALEQQFHQAQKLESLGVLAGGIAHDFNNLLAIVMGYCSLVKRNYQKAEKYIPEIEKAAERAAGLCRQMLAYAGKAPLTQSQVNMWMLVDEMVTMLKSTINKNVVIKANLSADIPFITGDASQLRQIVMNLIINASEAIGEAQGVIHVSITKTAVIAVQSDKDHLGKIIPAGGYLCLEVADNGCGMDDETRQRIFEPFYTTKFTGRGLGMSAVLGIITAHRGALQLSSQRGQGTTFKVYLPVQNSDSAGEESLPQIAQTPWEGSGTILLVEDEEQIILIANIMLKALGFTVIEASNGKDALELYQKNAADITLVVTDMGMPVMDGYELFRELKKFNPELPIIISSGFGDTVVTSRIAREEIAGLVSKPYRIDQLRKVLKSVVEDALPKQA